MKILTICYEDMGGNIGGVRQVMEISRNLHKLGHEVELVCPGIRRYSKDIPFRITYVPVVRKRVFQAVSFHLLFPFYLIARCRSFKPDIVLAYEIFLSCVPMLAAKISSIPYAVFVNGDTEDFKLQGFPGIMLWPIEMTRRVNFKFSSRIFTITDSLKEMLIRKYNLRPAIITVVNNGVDPEQFRPMEKAAACKKVGLESGNFYVGFLGGMWPWHGLDLLINGAARALQTLPDIKFVLAGHGPEKEKLLNLARRLGPEDSFVIGKEVDSAQVPAYINSFDICILFFKPVRKHQGNPIKLFEYLACGKPVIATDIKNYGFVLKEYGAGIAVNSESPEEVAKAIIRLAQDEGLREQMGRHARDAIVSRFTWEKTAQSIERDLKECLYGR